MTDQDLDTAYTALCNALADVGPAHAERFLSMLCLALLVRMDSAGDVVALIDSLRQGASQD